jgi:hypothetical protein
MPRGLEDPEKMKDTETPKGEAEAPQEKEVKPVEKDDGVTKTDDATVHWTVPKGTTRVTLFQYDKNGKYVKQFAISSYITMKPGETFIIKAK